MPADLDIVTRTLLTIVSVPVVAAALAWIARRLTKEGRLTVRVERLSVIYPNLPDGEAKREYAERVNEATAELNARLDPLFKSERRKKRNAVVAIIAAILLLVFVVSPLLDDQARAFIAAGWPGVIGGFVLTGAFLLIERDTKRQRAAIQAAKAAEKTESNETSE